MLLQSGIFKIARPALSRCSCAPYLIVCVGQLAGWHVHRQTGIHERQQLRQARPGWRPPRRLSSSFRAALSSGCKHGSREPRTHQRALVLPRAAVLFATRPLCKADGGFNQSSKDMS